LFRHWSEKHQNSKSQNSEGPDGLLEYLRWYHLCSMKCQNTKSQLSGGRADLETHRS